MSKVVIVKWADAWHSGGRYYREGGDFSPIVLQDVGFLVEENDETVVLCTSKDEEGDARHVSAIPVVNVIEIIEISFEGEEGE